MLQQTWHMHPKPMLWQYLGGLIHCRKGLVSQLLCLLVQVPGLLLELGHQRLEPGCESQHIPAHRGTAQLVGSPPQPQVLVT